MADNKSRVLVTGGAGFIGSHLCDSLIAQGLDVVCRDDLSTGDRGNISGIQGEKLFRFDLKSVEEFFDYDVDYIFHLASPASPVDYYRMPVKTMISNSRGTENCLELARKKGARMLMCSTSEVYGDPGISPQVEDYYGNVNPIGPRSCYDEGKRFSEALCKAYEREYGVDVVIVRIFNTYGPRMRKEDGRVIPNFVCQALEGKPLTVYGDGSQTRSFCYVSDMVRGLKKAMFTPEASGEVINIGNPREIEVLDLAVLIKKNTGSGSEMSYHDLPENDPHLRRPDISKAKRILGWEPEVNLETGLDHVIKWFSRNGW
ncbi:MAG: SDR family oxidoreductase [Actinobacteria bacterium]|nr:SDR family oxidoreductase [Actinomycetota bacterium]